MTVSLRHMFPVHTPKTNNACSDIPHALAASWNVGLSIKCKWSSTCSLPSSLVVTLNLFVFVPPGMSIKMLGVLTCASGDQKPDLDNRVANTNKAWYLRKQILLTDPPNSRLLQRPFDHDGQSLLAHTRVGLTTTTVDDDPI